MTNPYQSLTNQQLADKLSEVWADAAYEQHAALLETVIARLQATDELLAACELALRHAWQLDDYQRSVLRSAIAQARQGGGIE